MFLKNKKTISKLFTYGDKTIYKRPYHILISKNKGEAGFVIAVSKKLFKNAVDRNRIKRLIKAGLVNVNPGCSVAIIYIDTVMPDKKLIEQIKGVF